MPTDEHNLPSQQQLIMTRTAAIAQDVRLEARPDNLEVQTADTYLRWLLGLGAVTTVGLLFLRLSMG